MNCPKCGLDNPVGALFCMRCGKELSLGDGSEKPAELSCYRHPKTPTQLSCGRCGRPLCTKCVVLGPAGPRCPECARQNLPVRPGAILYGAKRSFLGIFKGGAWSIYIWILLISMLFGGVRGCMSSLPRERRPAVQERQESPPSRGTQM